jgi:DNA-directed RNA polymerase specialized sigma24 family protein
MINTLMTQRHKEDAGVFHARFWRCHRLLHFLACRVLGGSEWASDAVENCWLAASQASPRFEHEGEFRSWLARVLIDQALAIRHCNREHRVCVGPPAASDGQRVSELIQACGD